MRTKRLHRAIYREIAPPILIGLVVLTFVVFTREFGRLAEMLIRKNAGPATVLEVMASLLPSVLIFTVPLSFLIGTLIGFSRLSTDSEIVAMRAGGISVTQMLRPVLKLATLTTLVTLILTLFLLPLGNWTLRQIRHEIGLRPVQSQIKSRVFYEDLPGILLYVEDIDLRSSSWKGVLVADSGLEDQQRIILSKRGHLLFGPEPNRVQIHFENGAIYSLDRSNHRKDSVSRFGTQDLQITVPRTDDLILRTKKSEDKTVWELFRDLQNGDSEQRRNDLVEIHRRIALPLSALIFAILGVTLGISTHRGGRGYGFVVSMVVAFTYYILFATGTELASNGALSIPAGVWGADLLLGALSLLTLRLASSQSAILGWLTENAFVIGLVRSFTEMGRRAGRAMRAVAHASSRWIAGFPNLRLRIARVIDLYMVRSFFLYFLSALVVCVGLFYLFTFFELVDDLVRHQAGYPTLFEYFFYLLPHILILLVPISILIGTLTAFGILEKTNQITALKSCGISVFRIAMPILLATFLLSASMFLLQEEVLPYANQRQDNLRQIIKGKPAQTYYQTGERWIFGDSDRLYHYSHFDTRNDVFADLIVYELDLSENQLQRYISARRAEWDAPTRSWRLYDGVVRSFSKTAASVETFEQRLFEFSEPPPYFEEEVKESSKMRYTELRDYIEGLKQGGFEVDHLRTELYKKLSLPLVSFIMAALGIPFAFSLGKRGALFGVALGVSIGIIYWGAFGVFEVLGSNGLLSPALSAWGPNLVFGSSAFFMLLSVRT